MKAALLSLGLMLWAPYQCGTEPNERPQEDTAPKALWVLSEKFEAEGNSAARATTLNQLVAQYPSSHYAEKARIELGLPSRENSRKSASSGDEDEASDEKAEQAEKKSDKPAEGDPESGDE